VVPGLETVEGATVAVQGYGNAGAIAAQLFAEQGARIVAVSDSRGGVRSDDGLDPNAAVHHKARTGSVVGLAGTRPVEPGKVLELECDILIPAALENQIRADNAPAVRARLVVEAANGPTTPAADGILFERGIPVLPDILANAGGVTVSYFEWVQNNENEQWSLEDVNEKLRAKMETATDAVMDTQSTVNEMLRDGSLDGGLKPVDLRTAAYVLALGRVARVTEERGIWP
jgi:glutamate dehydrogenase (NAD(P)+)